MSDLVEKARKFAELKHKGVFRKGDGTKPPVPYFAHVENVAKLVKAAGGDEIAQAAAYLHDTVEDTDTTYEDLVREFGKEVADVVLENTDNPSLTVKQQKAAQIANMAHKSPRAKLVKMADKSDNLADLVRHPPVWPIANQVWYARTGFEVLEAGMGSNTFIDAHARKVMAAVKAHLEVKGGHFDG
jgi:(p)ppGpp synthase/HD superfamily hydrolase